MNVLERVGGLVATLKSEGLNGVKWPYLEAKPMLGEGDEPVQEETYALVTGINEYEEEGDYCFSGYYDHDRLRSDFVQVFRESFPEGEYVVDARWGLGELEVYRREGKAYEPPVKPSGFHVLAEDDSGHWYVIPVERKKEFEDWVDAKDADPPDYTTRINGGPSSVSFMFYRVTP